MNRLKKIIILGASELQLPAIKQAKKMGLYVISVDFNEKAMGFKFCDKKYVISTLDKEAVLKIAKKEQISGIMTLASDLPMRTVAFVSEKLKLPGISIETSEIVTNKYKMRECLKKDKIQSINFKKIKTISDVSEFFESTSKEAILKPFSSSGSRGVSFISKDDSITEIQKKFMYSLSHSSDQELIMEEFLSGSEVSVESVTIKGKTNVIQITDKITTGAPYFVETGHSQPANLSEEEKNSIEELVKAGVKSVGLENGVSHTEIIYNDNSFNIVEIGARLGGDFISTDLVPISTGVNLVEIAIKLALGEKINTKCKFNKGSAIRFFQYEEGLVKKISNTKDISDIKGVLKFQLKLDVGDKIPLIQNSTNRYGYIIAEGKNSEIAKKICNEAISMVEIQIQKNNS